MKAKNEKRRTKNYSVKRKSFTFYVLVFSFAFLAFSFFPVRSASAQSMNLSPAATTKRVGEEFVVNINIVTNNKYIRSADAKITYDSSLFEVVSIERGNFFDSGAENISTAGTIFYVGVFSQPLTEKNTDGILAKITLKGKKTGSGALSFVCTSQKNDTNLADVDLNDIIVCSATRGGTYTIIASGGDDTTPTATPTPVPDDDEDDGGGTTPTRVPTARPTTRPTVTPPVSGVALPTVMTFGAGLLLTIVALAVIF